LRGAADIGDALAYLVRSEAKDGDQAAQLAG
jgi:hypothetical protein